MSEMRGYQCLLNSLYNDEKLDSIARDILIFLNCYPTKAFPSIKLIVQKTGNSENTVKRRLKTLEELGYLKKISRGAKGITNLYFLDYEKIRPSHRLGHKELSGATKKIIDTPLRPQRPAAKATQAQELRPHRPLMYYKNKKLGIKRKPGPGPLDGQAEEKEKTIVAVRKNALDAEKIAEVLSGIWKATK